MLLQRAAAGDVTAPYYENAAACVEAREGRFIERPWL